MRRPLAYLAVLLAVVLLAMECGADPVAPGSARLEPGTLQCRRAMQEWVFAPGQNTSDPNYPRIRNRVIRDCTGSTDSDSPDEEGARPRND